MAQAVAFLKIPDVRGGASDPQHLWWIEVLSFSQDRGQGSAEFSITKAVDSTSPALFQLASAGKRFEGELDAVNNGRITLHLGLKGAAIVGVQIGGRASDGGPLQNLRLACESVEVEVR